MTSNEERYTPEEESFDPEGIAERRRQEQEEELRRRIRREIIRVSESEDEDEELDKERQRLAEEEAERKAEAERERRRQSSILINIFTGGFLSSHSASIYYRMLIAIAIMCFVCIFLTFMSLNADREYSQLDKRAGLLRERAILFEELRYDISTRENVDKILERHNIELVELDRDSRVIRSHANE
ncbi:MAG: hypothetical protein U0L61_07605 [Alistipes sp.]|jgi:hypothetical protein|nr:hypothetical protein [Alistipes sp.]